MSQAAIETLLRERIGLEAVSLGPQMLTRVLQKRMLVSGVSDLTAYFSRLQTSPLELEELIEQVVVPETWFFRDREPFTCLTQFLLTEWLPAHPGQVFRVLSAPCATGEEPYSIAISLLEAGLTPEQFQIEAIDISNKALQKAQKGLYSKHSFRGSELGFRDRYFTRVETHYQLKDGVRQTVQLRQGNLLDPMLLYGRPIYNSIFCRNVLIYFDGEARRKTIQTLDQALADGGLLFLGHSEMGQLPPDRFVALPHAMAFGYRKQVRPRQGQVSSRASLQPPTPQPATRPALSGSAVAPGLEAEKRRRGEIFVGRSAARRPPQPPPAMAPSPSVPATSPPAQSLQHAQDLANQGCLTEAANLCQTYLKLSPASAEAYVLLGQIHQSLGQESQAEDCFRKAIYLDPHHYDALVHLALACDQAGDRGHADRLWQRVRQRAKQEAKHKQESKQ